MPQDAFRPVISSFDLQQAALRRLAMPKQRKGLPNYSESDRGMLNFRGTGSHPHLSVQQSATTKLRDNDINYDLCTKALKTTSSCRIYAVVVHV
jgi:hypothetical protein